MPDILASIIDSRIYNGILIFTILCEFLIPWLLKHFYKGYDSKRMLLSILGCFESPVHSIYNIWLIWIGIFFSFTALVNYKRISEISNVYAIALFLSILAYAVGAGFLSGMFHMSMPEDVVTTSSKIHNTGAMIGFAAFPFSSLISGIVAFGQSALIFGSVCVMAFVAAGIFFIMLIIGGSTKFKDTIFAYEGLWERSALLCMYIPFIYVGIGKLI